MSFPPAIITRIDFSATLNNAADPFTFDLQNNWFSFGMLKAVGSFRILNWYIDRINGINALTWQPVLMNNGANQSQNLIDGFGIGTPIAPQWRVPDRELVFYNPQGFFACYIQPDVAGDDYRFVATVEWIGR